MTDMPNVLAFPTTGANQAQPSGAVGEHGIVIPIGETQTVTLEHRSRARSLPLGLADLWAAINEKRVHVHYQPQFDFSAGRTRAVEALARIVSESGTLVLPERFIRQAEDSTMIVPLGRAVIAKVCEDLAHWRRGGDVLARVAVNLSAHQLNVDESLVRHIDRCLSQNGLAPTDLEFELTEQQFLNSNATGMNTIAELADYGARLALDNFGVGYSSVACVSELPLATVKLNRSMVNRVPAHRTTERIVRHLIGIAGEMGVDVVAEGIETWDQHDYLAASGCNLGQGFLFAEPMPAAELWDFVRFAER